MHKRSVYKYPFLLLAFSALSIAPSRACSLNDQLGLSPDGQKSSSAANKTFLVRSSENASPPRIFNRDTRTLPANYTGIDPYLAYKVLLTSQSDKGEYERSHQHKQRSNLAIPYLIKYGFNTSHSLPFAVDVAENLSRNNYHEFKYDSDSKSLKYIMFPNWSNPYYEVIIQDSLEGGTYAARNIFGLETAVSRTVGCRLLIRFSQPMDRIGNKLVEGSTRISERKPILSNVVVSIPADTSQARIIRDKKLSLLFVVKLVPPYLTYNKSLTKQPTIFEPQSIMVKQPTMNTELQALLIYDRKSGQILGSKFFSD